MNDVFLDTIGLIAVWDASCRVCQVVVVGCVKLATGHILLSNNMTASEDTPESCVVHGVPALAIRVWDGVVRSAGELGTPYDYCPLGHTTLQPGIAAVTRWRSRSLGFFRIGA